MSSEDEDIHQANARKRRRLNPTVEPSSEDLPEPSSDSPQSLHDDNDDKQYNNREEREPQQPQRPKHRIHIVQNANLPDFEDEYFSQVPTATEDPHRMRGAYWIKQKPMAPPPPRPSVQSVKVLDSKTASRNGRPPESIGQQRHAPPPRPAVEMPPPAALLEAESEFLDEYEAALLEELADGFSDEFRSPGKSPPKAAPVIQMPSQEIFATQDHGPNVDNTRLIAPRNNLRQTTLFGQAVRDDGAATQASQNARVRNFPEANRDEPPTHHKLDREALKTWIYPTNLGTIRDYQYTIVGGGLYNNLLVALPTGLGKTFIAATIMLNWFRWTTDAQIVFVAPTRPLVAQQVDACFHIAGIPRSTTTLLTGQTPPALRAEEWETKRVFFMTPQTIINDLKTGICDPKRIVLVVVDEAHRATGNYAYVEMVTFLRRFNASFRVLALTATPGSSVESVQGVIDGLGIARTEIRTEESLDIRNYVHQRNIDTMIFDFDEEMVLVMDLLSNAIKPVLNKLTSCNAYWSKDPMALTAYGCTMARQKWMREAGKTANLGLKGMVNSIFTVLAGLAHSLELLKFHGIVPFYNKIRNSSNTDKKQSKYETQIRDHDDFKKMITMCRAWISNPDFLGHPKLEHLSSVVLNHFIDAGEGRDEDPEAAPSPTRVMIFAHYRDSAEEIVRVLHRHKPMIRPHVFVGQAASNGSDGMDQKKQQDIIEKFKKGTYNTLVATSIGEEGLDIGEVDLIICYDASASPIRMLQRMGRTGRKRAGNICVLLMKKKEQDNFEKAKDNYEKMQKMIASGDRFTYHQSLSPRIVPRDIKPEVDKRVVEIPIENSQSELPEPKKRKGKLPKRPPKKFHMPDGVITGFMKASDVGSAAAGKAKGKQLQRSPTPDPVPELSKVLLDDDQTIDLESRYLYISGEQSEVVEYPQLGRFPLLNQQPHHTKLVGHGKVTHSMIQMFRRMSKMDEAALHHHEKNLHPDDKDLIDRAVAGQAPVELDTVEVFAEDPIDIGSEDEAIMKTRSTIKPEATRKRKPSASKKKPEPHPLADNTEKDFDRDSDAERNDSDTLQPVTKRTRKRKSTSAKKTPPAKKPRKSKKKAILPPSPTQMSAPPSPTPMPSSTADIGIDILHTDEDDDPDEDDDDGSDLVDFIDDGPETVAMPSSSANSMLDLSLRARSPAKKRKKGLVLAEMDSDKENEELVDVEDLLVLSQPTPRKVSPKRRRGRRRVVVDSDEE